MRVWTAAFTVGLVCLVAPLETHCGAQVTLSWSPSATSTTAGYNLVWGTNSGDYIYTNFYTNTQTSAIISDLAANQAYFFAVQAVDSNGLVSQFSNEQEYTNAPSLGPQSPPGAGPPGSQTFSTNGGSGTNSGSSAAGTNSLTTAQSLFWGVPPLLSMAIRNGQVSLNINSTVGAMLTILSTTNGLSEDVWSPFTNVTITNVASVADTNQSNPDLLDLAFVPGTQTLALGGASAGHFQYFRAVMPCDYIILADQVLLSNSNYTPRLILVNMPGAVDDACYVNQTGSFIHCVRTNYALQLFSSGSTIRDIANNLADYLQLNWTSASEFTYSNGMGRILATVIETEPPSSDPVAGQNPPGPPTVIDF